jgi:uncharacterized membrane protein
LFAKRNASAEGSTKVAGLRIPIILYTIAAFIALLGPADATYLTVQALTGETLVCGGSPDCFRVLGSSYARVAGIPVAAFGTLAYLGVFSFATFAAFGYARARAFLTLTSGRCSSSRFGCCMCKDSCCTRSAVTVFPRPRSSSGSQR